MNIKQLIAKLIRYLSIPPVMITTLLLILNIEKPSIFSTPRELLLLILFLGFFPILAYPISALNHSKGNEARENQRKCAMILCALGYIIAFIISIVFQYSTELTLICLAYSLSVFLLIIFNYALPVHASGHAASIIGPMISLVCIVDWMYLIPCLILVGIIFWSSIYLKRHTLSELMYGSVICGVSFLFSYLLIFFK